MIWVQNPKTDQVTLPILFGEASVVFAVFLLLTTSFDSCFVTTYKVTKLIMI